jgi:hypothetical protein
MAAKLTAENVVRRIAAECTFIDERGARRHSPEPGRGDRAPVRRAIPPPGLAKRAKAAAVAVIAAAQLCQHGALPPAQSHIFEMLGTSSYNRCLFRRWRMPVN